MRRTSQTQTYQPRPDQGGGQTTFAASCWCTMVHHYCTKSQATSHKPKPQVDTYPW